MMIHWMWAVAALAVGAIIGLFLAAMIEAGREDEWEAEEDDNDAEDDL